MERIIINSIIMLPTPTTTYNKELPLNIESCEDDSVVVKFNVIIVISAICSIRQAIHFSCTLMMIVSDTVKRFQELHQSAFSYLYRLN